MPSALRSLALLVPGVRRLHESREAIMIERDSALENAKVLTARLDAALRDVADYAERQADSHAQYEALAAELASLRNERDGLVKELNVVRDALTAAQQAAAREVAIGQSDQRLMSLEAYCAHLNEKTRHETHRVDYLLAAQEGILALIDDFHAARTTTAYRAAFTQTEPLVSVTVITANRPDRLVSRCLRSLQTQTYRNLQIVVVGDHCVDDTEARIAALKDDRIIFQNLPARGPYPRPGPDRWRVAGTHAANHALSLCEGQFITHLDDDDRFDPERIATMVAVAQANEADLCWHPFWWENEDGTWRILGDGTFELSQIGTSSIFYHRYFTRIADDVQAYRIGEPGDWNRLRKIKMMRPKTFFVDQPLVYHYGGSQREPFVAQPGELFLE